MTAAESSVEARRRLHKSVKGLVDGLRRLSRLVDRYSCASEGLLWLDHFQLPENEPPSSSKDELALEWSSVIEKLRVNMSEALILWDEDHAGADTSLRLDFAGVGKVELSGDRNLPSFSTYHAVVIWFARVLLDPEGLSGHDVEDWLAEFKRTAVVRNAITQEVDEKVLRRVIRKRAVDVYLDRDFRKSLLDNLEAEYRRLLDRPVLVPVLSARLSASPESHAAPDGQVVLEKQDSGVQLSNYDKLDHAIVWVLNCADGPLSHQEIASALEDRWEWYCQPAKVKTIANHFGSEFLKAHTETAPGGRVLGDQGRAWVKDNPVPQQPPQSG